MKMTVSSPVATDKKTPFEMLTSANPLEFVQSVYSGKPGCACGCKGSYRYNSAMVEAASKSRGYAVTPDEVNDSQIKKVAKIILANWHVAEVCEAGEWASVEVTSDSGSVRVYTAYFAQK